MIGFSNVYHNKRVLITGHTGFKGSWLALWLANLGANVSGLALPPDAEPNHWRLLKLNIPEFYVDIRNYEQVKQVFDQIKPEIIFHLAAQPLVKLSYENPIETWSTNVMGTVNILEACRHVPELSAVVVVTSDKCYQNNEWHWGYRENDPLGGHDPYSASKAGAEIVVTSYRKSFFQQKSHPLLATGRAGNVIGGGDWSKDRLIPDAVRSIENSKRLEIRSPNATRPWQHVLESLSGYLLLGKNLLEGAQSTADSWNFGPEYEGNRSVEQILHQLKLYWPKLDWEYSGQFHPHESNLLFLDTVKAKTILNWQPVWSFKETIEFTAQWYSDYLDSRNVTSEKQLNRYINDAKSKSIQWSQG